MRITKEMKLYSRLTGIFIEHLIRLLLNGLCLGWMVGTRYSNDIELPILQNLHALEEWRNCPFIIQCRWVIVKIITLFDDFLLFSTPEHGKHNRKIHASLHIPLCVHPLKESDKVYLYITQCPSEFMLCLCVAKHPAVR